MVCIFQSFSSTSILANSKMFTMSSTGSGRSLAKWTFELAFQVFGFDMPDHIAFSRPLVPTSFALMTSFPAFDDEFFQNRKPCFQSSVCNNNQAIR